MLEAGLRIFLFVLGPYNIAWNAALGAGCAIVKDPFIPTGTRLGFKKNAQTVGSFILKGCFRTPWKVDIEVAKATAAVIQ